MILSDGWFANPTSKAGRCSPRRGCAWRMQFVLAALLGAAVTGNALGGQANSLMDISADGKLLACANRDSGSVTVVDLATHTKLREIQVGKKPEGLSFLGDTHRLAVAVYGDDVVHILNADAGTRERSIDVFDEPYAVVSTADGGRIYVTLEYPGQIVEIDPVEGHVVRTFDAGRFPRGIALAPDESRLYYCEYFTAVVRVIDLKDGQTVDEWTGPATDNLARQLVVHPRRPKVYLSHIRSKITAVHGAGSIFPYLAIVDTRPGEDRRRTRIPMDAFRGNLVTANPWEVAVSPDGRRLYIVFAGTNDMFACDIVDDDYREVAEAGYLQLGNNPRAVRVAPDGNTFYVYNALDFNVVAYDAKQLRPVASVSVCDCPLDEDVLAGKRLFYSALQPMVSRRWISCSSCHPDGDADGRTWHNPEGLRNTQSLAGMAWTHPIHWSADRDEVQDFEHTIRGPLMQGRGLIRGKLNDSLAEPNRELSAELDAVAAYANSHAFPLSPHAKGGLSAAAHRGRELFFSKETRCATCHAGPLYTDSRPDAGGEFVLHDVGTGGDDPSEKMGPKYDTPTLLGVYRTAPYLHHGRAVTLRDVLTTCNAGDRHGKTSHLSDAELDDLVEFLKSLPFEDPEPAAREAGLVKIER
ncbi:MAG: c-type cytochrome [Planctomycetes bacterium]|nr:c-type cytochrome [Planctomycetota bacterium]